LCFRQLWTITLLLNCTYTWLNVLILAFWVLIIKSKLIKIFFKIHILWWPIWHSDLHTRLLVWKSRSIPTQYNNMIPRVQRVQMQPGPTASRAFRSTEELEIINFGHPSDDWPLRTLLSFRDRTLSKLTVGPSSSSLIFRNLHALIIILIIWLYCL
jgi:hypothetical protein